MARRVQSDAVMEIRTPSFDWTRFYDAVRDYIAYGQLLTDAAKVNGHVHGFEPLKPNSKFLKLVCEWGGQTSVFGYVRVEDGAILYAASWKKPFIAKGGPMDPKTIRGSIYDKGTWARCTAWTGVKTIR